MGRNCDDATKARCSFRLCALLCADMGRFLCLLFADLPVAWPLLLVVDFVDLLFDEEVLLFDEEVFFAGAAVLPVEAGFVGDVALCSVLSACVLAPAYSRGSSNAAANKAERNNQRLRPTEPDAVSKRFATSLIKRNSSYESTAETPSSCAESSSRIQTVNEYEFVPVPLSLLCTFDAFPARKRAASRKTVESPRRHERSRRQPLSLPRAVLTFTMATGQAGIVASSGAHCAQRTKGQNF